MSDVDYDKEIDNLVMHSSNYGFNPTGQRWDEMKHASDLLKLTIDALRAENAALREAQRCIPTSERLPEQGQRVRIWINGTESIGAYWKDAHQWTTINDLHYHGDTFGWITHWQPIPPAPDEA